MRGGKLIKCHTSASELYVFTFKLLKPNNVLLSVRICFQASPRKSRAGISVSLGVEPIINTTCKFSFLPSKNRIWESYTESSWIIWYLFSWPWTSQHLCNTKVHLFVYKNPPLDLSFVNSNQFTSSQHISHKMCYNVVLSSASQCLTS
jgi:hypothetical protein